MTDKNESMLLGGLVVGLLSTSYLGLLNMFCCLGVMIGAAVGVWHYTSNHRATIPSGDGAGLGAGAAFFGFILSLLLNFMLLKLGLGYEQAIFGMLQSLMEGMVSPEQLAEIQQQLEAAQNRSFLEYLFNFGTLMGLIIYPIFGAVGGAIGAVLFKYGSDEETGEAEYEVIE